MADVTSHQFVLALLGLGLIVAAASDLRALVIPNRLVLFLAALYPLHVLLSPSRVDWAWALAVAFFVLSAGFIAFLRNLAGGGDVKLAAVMALWAGPGLVMPFLFIMGLAGGSIAAIVLLLGRVGPYVELALDSRLAGAGGVVAARWRARPVIDWQHLVVPYGLAIALGGFFVLASLAIAGPGSTAGHEPAGISGALR